MYKRQEEESSQRNKKNKKEEEEAVYRVDYNDFSAQVCDFTQCLTVLPFVAHGAVMREGELITEAMKLKKDVPIPPADFTPGDLEAEFMRIVEDAQLKGAEVGRSSRLMPENLPRKQAGAFPSDDSLKSGGELPLHTEIELQRELKHVFRTGVVSWVFGGTGVGKSRRTPPAAQMAMAAEGKVVKGTLHVSPRKLSSDSLLEIYKSHEFEVVQNMASVWNGDLKLAPMQREFVVLSTPVSTFHLLQKASSWKDLSLIVFDEIQVKDGLVAFLIVYVLDMIMKKDPRANGVRVLLMTATPEGPAFSTLQSVLNRMQVFPGTVTLAPCESWKPCRRTELWKVVHKPRGWGSLSQHAQVCEALILMTEWLWNNQNESASILIFCAGESEVFRMRNAILMSSALAEKQNYQWAWEVQTLYGGCSKQEEQEAKERMDSHKFNGDRALFLILTPGKGEDGWTPRANGMINCSEQIEVDNLNFLHKKTSDWVSNLQREGRVGRGRDGLYLHLKDGVEPSSAWEIHYAQKLQVGLAVMDLDFNNEIPALSTAQQKDVEADLVKGDIVFKIRVVWDPAGLPSVSYPLGTCAWLSKAQQSCVPATALVLQTMSRFESLHRLVLNSLVTHCAYLEKNIKNKMS